LMMKPQLLDRIVSPEGEVLYKFKPQVIRRVVSEKTSRVMRDIMAEVVTKGTGDNARIPRYTVGGKTGTAQIAIGGSYAGRKFVGSFIGFSPVADPKVLVFSIVIDPKGAYYGGVVAAPAFQRVMLQSLLYKKVPPTDLDDRISPTGAEHND